MCCSGAEWLCVEPVQSFHSVMKRFRVEGGLLRAESNGAV